MTNGEIIEQLKNAIDLIKQDGKDWLDDRDIPILEECIKSLTALDKIRAELKGMYRVILKDTPKDDWAVRWNDCLDEVLEIIDKYKTE